ncbi:MAG: STAS domain-containing protein [Deltaproteobacteria bacterium]|jgi:anti-sigma B factor antagonist|nr:STAS domain-containing protein [Deltaproteobacteria bacterium]
MKINFENQEKQLVAILSGRLEATNAAEFDQAFQTTPDKNVLLDLAGLDFISSAGLRSLLTLGKALKAKKLELAFCSLNALVSEVFAVSGFNSIFPVYPSQAAQPK